MKAETNAKSAIKKVLHIGCGQNNPVHPIFANAQWQEVRCDNRSNVNADIVADMANMNMIGSGEYDAVYSVNTLSRYYAHQVPKALQEIYRILNVGGCAVLLVPDIKKIAKSIAKGQLEQPLYESGLGKISAIDLLYGLRPVIANDETEAQRTAFTEQTLGIKLREAGFLRIQIKKDGFLLFAIAHKLAEGSALQVNIEEEDLYKMMQARDNLDKEPELSVLL